MPNYKMTICYDGSRYFGWEHQPNTDMTIQGKLETVLNRLTGKEVKLIGAGRTDAGVHARGMTANVWLDPVADEEEMRRTINQYLPEDICITDFRQASDRFHSRYNAVGKTYRYSCYVGDAKPVFDRKYVYTLETVPDIDRMRQAADHLMGKHDYASFCGNPKMKKSTVRIVDRIEIRRQGDYLTLRDIPATNGVELARMNGGETVEYFGTAENNFYLIRYNGTMGYAMAQYLK